MSSQKVCLGGMWCECEDAQAFHTWQKQNEADRVRQLIQETRTQKARVQEELDLLDEKLVSLMTKQTLLTTIVKIEHY